MTASVALNGGIRQLSVNLHNTGFGIDIGRYQSPKLWFAHSNSYARYDPEAGVLEVTERPRLAPGRWQGLPLLWLNLPEAYGKKQVIDVVDITARGDTKLKDIGVSDLTVNTWGDVALTGVRIGSACLAKTIHGNVTASGVNAPAEGDPGRSPSADLVAITGIVTVAESSGSWRMVGREVHPDGANGPQHITLLTPLRQPQTV